MARKIVITSGKGGVGKTTVTANLGLALASLGLRVLLVDIDVGLNNLDVVIGVENKIVYDISDVLEGRCRIRQALVQDDNFSNLYILPSGKLNSNCVSGQNIKLLLESVVNLFDYILIDCPAGIDIGFHRAVSCVDEALVVTTSNMTSIRDADKVISIINSYKLNSVKMIINRARGDLIMNEKIMSPQDVQEILKVDLVGILPEEDVVFLSTGKGLPNGSQSKKAYKMLAQNIHKGTRKLYNTTKKYSGFFGSIRRGIKGSVWGAKIRKLWGHIL